MSQVWNARLPPLQKLALLAIADKADDDGRWQMSNEQALAAKCSLAAAELSALIGELIANGTLGGDGGPQPGLFSDEWYWLRIAPVEVLT